MRSSFCQVSGTYVPQFGVLNHSTGAGSVPTYSDVEIGRSRITGVETAAGSKEGIAFAMYHVEQYTAPSGEYSKVFSADGTQWYKQYVTERLVPCVYVFTAARENLL